MLSLIRRKLLDALTPELKLVGEAHMPYTHKLVNGLDFYSVQKLIKPGMIWLTHIDGEASGLLIPGFWSHAAVAVDDRSVVQATGDQGVVITDLVSFLLSKDYVILLRPSFATDAQMGAAAAWAAKQVGAPYDYDFGGGTTKAFYCSELVWASYREAVGSDVPFMLEKTLGVDTVVPNDIAKAADKFPVVWLSASCNGRRLS